MKYRIIKKPNGVYQVEKLSGSVWMYVSQTTALTLEEVETLLAKVLSQGEQVDQVIREVEV